MRADGDEATSGNPDAPEGPGDATDEPSGHRTAPPPTVHRLLSSGLELPEQGTGARAARRAAPGPAAPAARPATAVDPRWRAARPYLYVLALTALVATGIALGIGGYRVVRDSTDGKTVDPTLDPDEAGYEAFVEPSPTMLVLGRDDEGGLGWAALLAAPVAQADAPTSVVVVPVGLLVPAPPSQVRLDTLFTELGATAARSALAERLGLGIADVVEVDDARLAVLIGAVGPMPVRNSDRAEGFPAGDVVLTADQVGAFLAAPGRDGESERAVRQERVWRALASASASAGAAGGTGEASTTTASGAAATASDPQAALTRLLAGLGRAAARVDVLPVIAADGVEPADSFALDPDSAPGVLARAVPFPTAASPGGRTRLRVLDASGHPDLPRIVAPRLAAAGAEIVIVGNAGRLDRTESLVVYHDPAFAPAAEALTALLGVGRAEQEAQPTDTYDVTVLLGADAVEPVRAGAAGVTVPDARSKTAG